MAFQYQPSGGLEFTQYLQPLFGAPLDPRTIVTSLDTLDSSEFLSYHPFLGMIVIVLNDQDENNNGLWYKAGNSGFDHNGWKHIIPGEGTEFHWPENPGAQQGVTYVLEWNEGDPQWIALPEPEDPSTFTFILTSPYIEFGSGSGSGYFIGSDLQSSEQITLHNHYEYNNEHKTADVIGVKDSNTEFHLMLNPEINYILFGGDSNGARIVQLTVDSPKVIGKNEALSYSGGPIGLQWFIDSELYSTDPSDADVHWYPTFEDAQNKTNEIQNTSDPIYNYLDEDGESLTIWAIATHEGYHDSYIREIIISIVDDTITVDTLIRDITRTTAQANIES